MGEVVKFVAKEKKTPVQPFFIDPVESYASAFVQMLRAKEELVGWSGCSLRNARNEIGELDERITHMTRAMDQELSRNEVMEVSRAVETRMANIDRHYLL